MTTGVKYAAVLLASAAFLSCSAPARKGSPADSPNKLTEKRLWEINRDVTYTIFIYDDWSRKAGLMLRWKPDSILIQPRKSDVPEKIPTAGIRTIRVETGNRIWESLVAGGAAAGIWAAIFQSWDLSGASAGEGIAKLFGPPLIIFTAITIGAGMDRYEEYRVPENFEFDFDKANTFYEAVE